MQKQKKPGPAQSLSMATEKAAGAAAGAVAQALEDAGERSVVVVVVPVIVTGNTVVLNREWEWEGDESES